MQFSQYVY